MADAMVLDTAQTTDTGAKTVVDGKGSADTSKVQVPGYVKGQLGADGEALMKEIEKDPKVAEGLPKGIPELFKSWRTLQQESTSAVRIPAKDAPKEAWDRYFKAIGRPDSPEGYALTKPQLPNGLPYNDRLEKWFRQQLFDAGVPDGAAQKMFNEWNATQVAAYTANQKALEAQRVSFAKEAEEALRAEYKDEFPQAMQSMSAALARFGGAKIVETIKQARLPNGATLDNHPDFIRMFVEVGRRMDADTMVAGDAGAGKTDTSRPGLPINPVTGKPLPQFYPTMEKDARYRVKAE